MVAILDDAPIIDCSDGASASLPPNYETALNARQGQFLRKVNAVFVPNSQGTICWADLNIREFYVNNSVVKHVVDVISGYEQDVDEERIKVCIKDGEHQDLPDICRPPLGATFVNHFAQVAFIARMDGKHDVVKWITFESEGAQGKVLTALASTYAHGQLHYINYGSNQINGINEGPRSLI